MDSTIINNTHKRLNILTNEWVLVSPNRLKRPWQGSQEAQQEKPTTKYDEECYLCPGNMRASQTKNPNYTDTYVFTNDFSALHSTEVKTVEKGLLVAQSEAGICKVVCYSPNHSKTMADLNITEITKVIATWQREFSALSKQKDINYIQIFENKGAMMGCSNPHPHGQIWAQYSIPNEVQKKDINQLNYFQEHKKGLLASYLVQELKEETRIIYQNEQFVVLVPYWAVWPFETMVLPKEKQASIIELNKTTDFAKALSVLTRTYDKLFNCSFPYSCGIHQAPTNGKSNEHWHWHMSFYPPLLRSANIKKFMVGYELFGMPQRDITAEMAAERLRKIIGK